MATIGTKTTKTSYQKTESLLYNYMKFKDAIKDKQDQIKELKAYGLKKTSGSVIRYQEGGVYMNDTDKLSAKIEEIQASINTTEYYINIIDNELEKLKNDKYFDIIPLKYFNGYTLERIADELSTKEVVEVSTISRNKTRLINQIKIRLFPNEVIEEIIND